MEQTLVKTLKNYISLNKDSVFTLSSFNSYKFKDYSYSSIKRTINQLKQEGYIDQIMTGVYFKPKLIKSINKYSLPNIEDVVKQIAKNRQWTVSISGERSLNLLGLSTQQSYVYVYASTGPYKKYTINNNRIIFKRCKTNELANMCFETKLLIQGLKTLGKENINKNVIKILKNRFSKSIKEKIFKESRYTTKWISNTIKEICL